MDLVGCVGRCHLLLPIRSWPAHRATAALPLVPYGATPWSPCAAGWRIAPPPRFRSPLLLRAQSVGRRRPGEATRRLALHCAPKRYQGQWCHSSLYTIANWGEARYHRVLLVFPSCLIAIPHTTAIFHTREAHTTRYYYSSRSMGNGKYGLSRLTNKQGTERRFRSISIKCENID